MIRHLVGFGSSLYFIIKCLVVISTFRHRCKLKLQENLQFIIKYSLRHNTPPGKFSEDRMRFLEPENYSL